MVDEILRIATPAIGAIVGLLLAYAITQIKTYLAVHTTKAQFEALIKMGHVIVNALEQDIGTANLPGDQKKEMALIWMQQMAEKYGIPFDMNLASNAIEAAVKEMNAMLGEGAVKVDGAVKVEV